MNAFRNLNGAMKKKKYYSRTEFESPASSTVEPIASRYANGEYRLVNVFVEGYDDVAFGGVFLMTMKRIGSNSKSVFPHARIWPRGNGYCWT